MKKYLFLLLLSGACFFGSGFGAPENNVYVRQEQKANERIKLAQESVNKQDLVSVSDQIELEKRQAEQSDISKSISEKLGEFIMWGFEMIIKTVLNLFQN